MFSVCQSFLLWKSKTSWCLTCSRKACPPRAAWVALPSRVCQTQSEPLLGRRSSKGWSASACPRLPNCRRTSASSPTWNRLKMRNKTFCQTMVMTFWFSVKQQSPHGLRKTRDTLHGHDVQSMLARKKTFFYIFHTNIHIFNLIIMPG